MKQIKPIFCFFCMMIHTHLCGHAPIESPPKYTANTASQDYDSDFVSLLELIYGEGLLSQGGVHSIDEMFSGIDINGLQLLDLGSGLGMHDIHLAKNHCVDIVGVDPQEKLIQKSFLNLEKYGKDLKGTVSFSLMKDPSTLAEFNDNSFDIIFSKESILHVPCEMKEAYFKEVHRVLRAGGQVLIMDWMRSGPTYRNTTIRMMEMDGVVYQLSTQKEYENLLKAAGFNNIEFIDTTAHHAELSQQNIDTIASMGDFIKNQFGEETYEYSMETWAHQRDAFQTRDLLTGIFKASK